jgi:hypothetical protein
MEKESSGQRPVEANSTGGQGSRRAVAPSDDDDVQCMSCLFMIKQKTLKLPSYFNYLTVQSSVDFRKVSFIDVAIDVTADIALWQTCFSFANRIDVSEFGYFSIKPLYLFTS